MWYLGDGEKQTGTRTIKTMTLEKNIGILICVDFKVKERPRMISRFAYMDKYKYHSMNWGPLESKNKVIWQR